MAVIAIGAVEVTRITGCAGNAVPNNSLASRVATSPAVNVIDAVPATLPLAFSAWTRTVTPDAVGLTNAKP